MTVPPAVPESEVVRREKKPSLLARLLLVACSVALSFGAVELLLRVAVPAGDTGFYSLMPGSRQVSVLDPTVVHGVEGEAEFAVNELGIRGRPFGDGDAEYRLLAVGGSTTENMYLSPEESWHGALERALGSTADGRKVWVGSVGRAGLSSRHHVLQVEHHLEDYPRIDQVLVLAGVNDLTTALALGAQYEPIPPSSDQAMEETFVHQGRFGTRVWSDVDPWFKKTATWQLFRGARRAFQVIRNPKRQDSHGQFFAQMRAHRAMATGFVNELPDLTRALAEFRDNLEEIRRLTRAHGTELVLMTQPSIWRSDNAPEEIDLMWLGGTGAFMEEAGHEYYEPAVLARAMDLYNQVTLDVCRRDPEIVCVDLASEVPANAEMFFDDVHFTEAGSLKVAEVLATHLRARRPFATGGSGPGEAGAPMP